MMHSGRKLSSQPGLNEGNASIAGATVAAFWISLMGGSDTMGNRKLGFNTDIVSGCVSFY
jgi:hypothetical protein